MLKSACLIAIVMFVASALFAQSSKKADNSAPTKVTGDGTKTADGLQYWDIKVGTGATAAAGHSAKVHYTGWLTNGTKFDSSVDRGEPFTLEPLGARRSFRDGMKASRDEDGGKRQLRIPPQLGYGSRGSGWSDPG